MKHWLVEALHPVGTVQPPALAFVAFLAAGDFLPRHPSLVRLQFGALGLEFAYCLRQRDVSIGTEHKKEKKNEQTYETLHAVGIATLGRKHT